MFFLENINISKKLLINKSNKAQLFDSEFKM